MLVEELQRPSAGKHMLLLDLYKGMVQPHQLPVQLLRLLERLLADLQRHIEAFTTESFYEGMHCT